MISNKYQFALVDYSWLASRSAFIVSMGKEAGQWNYSDIIRLCIQSIAKLTNQMGITFDKCIMVHDLWSAEYNGYYRHYLLDGEYKDSRVYLDELEVEKMREDPTKTPEEIQKATNEAFFNRMRQAAKQAVRNELTIFPSIGVYGAEADDIFNIFSTIYNPSGDPSIKKSVIISKDSDLIKCVSPSTDFYKYGKSSEPPHVWTYEEALETIPDNLKGKISLYWYHSLVEALGAGHNDVKSPRKKNSNISKVLEDIVLRGDYSQIEDMERFKKSMSSYELDKFPMYQEIVDTISSKLMVCGYIPTLTEFRNFCIKHNLEGISDRYYSQLASKLDRSLYCEPSPVQKMF